MAIDYTTTGIVNAIKLKGILPDAQQLFLPDDLISIMDGEMKTIIVPQIMSAKQEYLVSSYDQSISSGQTKFFIPHQAIGGKLRDFVLVNADGKEIGIDRYEPEDVKTGGDEWTHRGFFVDNDQVNLLPTDGDFVGYSARMKIFRRPNNLVLESKAAKVTAINTSSLEVTCDKMPSHFTTSLTYDFVKGKPSFRCHAENKSISTIVGFVLKFSETLPEDLAIGDWVAETGFSPIPQIPYELHPLLEQRVVIKCLEGMKDRTGLELASKAYDEMLNQFGFIVAPRVDGTPQKAVSRRGISGYSSIRFGGW